MRPLAVVALGGTLAAGMLLAGPATAQQYVVCESSDGRYNQCYIDTRGGVRLDQQLSRATCRYNDSWGYDRQGIWVTKGCRARFRVDDPGWNDSSSGGWAPPAGSNVRCESVSGRRQFCEASTRGGVRLARQLSRADCTYGSTWGYDRRGIWVDRGCRADFELQRSSWSGGGPTPEAGGTIVCESVGNRRNYCRADTRDGVRLAEQLSRTPCSLGSTWGYDSGGVWVRDGCRGRFELRGGFASSRPPAATGGTVTCESLNNRRNYCRADTRGGVRLERQHSSSPCNQGSTWGFDSGGIWVERGCRATFAIGYGYRASDTRSSSSSDAAKILGGVALLGAVAAIAASADGGDQAVEVCQREIERRIQRDVRSATGIRFSSGRSEKDGSYRDVFGSGQFSGGVRTESFRYECRLRSDVVLTASYDS